MPKVFTSNADFSGYLAALDQKADAETEKAKQKRKRVDEDYDPDQETEEA